YTLAGYDKNDKQLFSLSFAGVRVADLNNTRHFTFAVPVDRINIKALKTIQLSGRSLKALQKTSPAPKTAKNKKKVTPDVAARRVSRNSVSIKWNNSNYKMALVKNAQTGETLGFINPGTTKIKSGARKLEVYFSDGVQTTVKRIEL
ncbi:MAG TPA: hypothetical protein VK106_02025, partial [Balneolaceae bacterium]|nr:hypothetical protein [Balneolaceae bacterium]